MRRNSGGINTFKVLKLHFIPFSSIANSFYGSGVSLRVNKLMQDYLIRLEMAWSSSLTHVMLSELMNPCWITKTQPCLVTAARTFFMLTVKGVWLTSCTAGILLYIFIRPLPQWRPETGSRRSGTSPRRFLCTESKVAHSALIGDRCWGRLRQTGKLQKGPGIFPASILWLYRSRRMKWQTFLSHQ